MGTKKTLKLEDAVRTGSKDQYMLQIAMLIQSEETMTCQESFYVCDHHQPFQIPMRIRKPKIPAMRRATSRGGDSTVHLLNLAVADST